MTSRAYSIVLTGTALVAGVTIATTTSRSTAPAYAAAASVPYAPSLAVSTAPPGSRSETRIFIAVPFGAPATADAELLVPAAYGADLSQPPGTTIGQLTGAINNRGLTPSYSGTVTVADPNTPGTGCDTSGHSAIWTATLTSAAGSFSFPIFVHALAGQATELHWCLSKTAPDLNELMVDVGGVFTRPVRGVFLWDGRFTPYDPVTGNVVDGEQVSALALVRLPQIVKLRVTYSRRAHRYVAVGAVTEDARPVVARVLISKSIGGGPFRSSRAGLTQTDASGHFTVSGRLNARRIVRFRAHASAGHRDISTPSCGKDINGVPCVHKSLAIWEKDSNVVAIRP